MGDATTHPQNDRVPPHSLQAERCVLGSMLLDSSVIPALASDLRPEHFVRDANATLYRELLSLYDANGGRGIDLVTVREHLTRRGLFEAIGGDEFLVGIVNAVPASDHAEYYARIVCNKYRLRSIIGAAGDLLRSAYDESEGPEVVLDRCEARLADLSAVPEFAVKSASIAEMAMLSNDRILMPPNDRMPTGLREVDHILRGGLAPSTLTLVAGRPSMGKSAVATSVGSHWTKQGIPVALFSLEMSAQDLVDRIVQSRSGVSADQIAGQPGGATAEQARLVAQASADTTQEPWHIIDDARLTVSQIRMRARRLIQQKGVRVVILDYIQLVDPDGRCDRQNREQQVSEVSRGLKALAKELRVPVVAMAQLNRATDGRVDHRPRLSDLRESGSLEQDADVVILLHREEYYRTAPSEPSDGQPPVCGKCNVRMVEKEGKYGLFWGCPLYPKCRETKPIRTAADMAAAKADAGIAEWHIAKQRNGRVGLVRVQWSAETTTFRDLARQSDWGGE